MVKKATDELTVEEVSSFTGWLLTDKGIKPFEIEQLSNDSLDALVVEWGKEQL